MLQTDYSKVSSKTYYDIIIIGGGVIGCAIAHEAVQNDLKVLLLEKEDDISESSEIYSN